MRCELWALLLAGLELGAFAGGCTELPCTRHSDCATGYVCDARARCVPGTSASPDAGSPDLATPDLQPGPDLSPPPDLTNRSMEDGGDAGP